MGSVSVAEGDQRLKHLGQLQMEFKKFLTDIPISEHNNITYMLLTEVFGDIKMLIILTIPDLDVYTLSLAIRYIQIEICRYFLKLILKLN